MRRALLLSLIALASCAPAVTPVTPLPPGLPPESLAAVRVERVVIEGFPEGHTPPEFNRAVYLRYSLPAVAKPRAVVVLVPGLLGGATGFDRLARTLVARDPSLEAWAVDRRSNLLEDHSRLEAAVQAKDPRVSWQYYVRDAGQPGGFQPVQAREAAFAGYWGLPVALGDLRVVVTRARAGASRVILAGHSLGTALVTQYAGWDFAGRAGAEDLSGLVLLDGAPGASEFGSLSEQDYRNGSGGLFGSRVPGTRALEAGEASPFLNGLGLDPATLARGAAAALLAALDPEGDSPGGVVPYPASNLAAGLVQIDDDYALVPFFAASAGHADAALGGNLLAVLTRGLAGFRVASVVGPREGRRRVEWVSPVGSDQSELTDPLDLVSRYWTQGVDFSEWYFPIRLTLDVSAAGLEAPEWARASLPLTHLRRLRLPVLALVGSRGLNPDPGAFQRLEAVTGRPVERRVLPGFTHLDVLTARSSLVADEILAFTR